LSLGVAFLFCLLLIQFYRIQIIEKDLWLKKANSQHQLTLVEPCKRGTFYSNTTIKEGHLEQPLAFVTDVPRFHLYADVTTLSTESKAAIIKDLSFKLKLSPKEITKLSHQLEKNSKSRRLFSWMTPEKKIALENWWQGFAKKYKLPRNALFFLQDFKRSYPYGSMLGPILHTVREQRDPKTHAHIPTGGLELSLDSYLRGKEGKRILLRSPRNALDLGNVTVAPENGADVFLTINHYLQAIAEEEIAKGVLQAGAKTGWAILMDPYTGHILAWAQYPSFDPNQYSKYFNSSSLQEHTKVKGITDPFEPGSTMKPITMLICLKANEELIKRGKKPLFSPHEKIATASGSVPGRSKPIHDVRTHQYLNMYMAIQKSSNIYMAKMIQRVIESLGDEWYRNCLAEIFRFGVKTGIELTSESSGLLPSPKRKHPNGAVEWSKPTPYSLSFGHNILVSSLQMVRAYAMIANGGYPIEPTLIRKIVKTKSDGTLDILVDHTLSCIDKGQTPLFSKESLKEVVHAMMYVTKSGGAAPRADIFGYTEVGKTATSEKIVNGTYSKKNNISTFLGWAPAKEPKFVLMIVIDEPEWKYIPGVGKNQQGGTCAAPIFREIGKKTLEYLGIEPDDPYGFPIGDPRRDPDKAIWNKEAKQLSDLYKSWNGT
jgi:cell division protein FtsI (penicillin-binding protein 3)